MKKSSNFVAFLEYINFSKKTEKAFSLLTKVYKLQCSKAAQNTLTALIGDFKWVPIMPLVKLTNAIFVGTEIRFWEVLQCKGSSINYGISKLAILIPSPLLVVFLLCKIVNF